MSGGDPSIYIVARNGKESWGGFVWALSTKDAEQTSAKGWIECGCTPREVEDMNLSARICPDELADELVAISALRTMEIDTAAWWHSEGFRHDQENFRMLAKEGYLDWEPPSLRNLLDRLHLLQIPLRMAISRFGDHYGDNLIDYMESNNDDDKVQHVYNAMETLANAFSLEAPLSVTSNRF